MKQTSRILLILSITIIIAPKISADSLSTRAHSWVNQGALNIKNGTVQAWDNTVNSIKGSWYWLVSGDNRLAQMNECIEAVKGKLETLDENDRAFQEMTNDLISLQHSHKEFLNDRKAVMVACGLLLTPVGCLAWLAARIAKTNYTYRYAKQNNNRQRDDQLTALDQLERDARKVGQELPRIAQQVPNLLENAGLPKDVIQHIIMPYFDADFEIKQHVTRLSREISEIDDQRCQVAQAHAHKQQKFDLERDIAHIRTRGYARIMLDVWKEYGDCFVNAAKDIAAEGEKHSDHHYNTFMNTYERIAK